MITAMKSTKKIPAGISENNEGDGRRAKDSSQRGKEFASVACHTGGSAHRRYAIVFIDLSFPYKDGREKNTNLFAHLVMSRPTVRVRRVADVQDYNPPRDLRQPNDDMMGNQVQRRLHAVLGGVQILDNHQRPSTPEVTRRGRVFCSAMYEPRHYC